VLEKVLIGGRAQGGRKVFAFSGGVLLGEKLSRKDSALGGLSERVVWLWGMKKGPWKSCLVVLGSKKKGV